MPPKPKFNQEEVIAAALDIIRKNGEKELTARKLAKALNSSTRPIFTIFENMDALKKAVMVSAMQILRDYFNDFEKYDLKFKYVGMKMIAFANEEPNLFHFIMLGNQHHYYTLSNWHESMRGEEVVELVEKSTGLDRETCETIFTEIALHTLALCMLMASGILKLSEQDISTSLSHTYLAIYSIAKAGKLSSYKIGARMPEKGGNSLETVEPVPIVSPF